MKEPLFTAAGEALPALPWPDYPRPRLRRESFLNLNGRICAEGLLIFGIGGVTVVYILAPLIDNLLHKADQRIVKLLCLVFLTLFCLDLVYSKIHPNAGKGVTDIGSGIPEETQQADF